MSGRAASPARRAALDALGKAGNRRAPGLDVLLDEALGRAGASTGDAALAREIACGVLRNRQCLEAALARFVTRSLEERAPQVHLALLTGLYQLVSLDRVPAHAAVDETVRLVAAQPGGARLKDLANAVMRRASKLPREALLPAADVSWRVRTSVSDSVADEVAAALGEAGAREFFEASNAAAPLCFRIAASAPPGTRDALAAQIARIAPDASPRPGLLVPDCVIAEGRGIAPGQLETFRAGHVTVEDEGAQAACLLAAGERRASRILDLCAAPGGKTAHLADLLPGAAITACDVAEPRLARLRETLARLGHDRRVDVRNAREILASEPDGAFDLVLVDAPCSGLGTLRRHPEIRYRRRPEDFENLARSQFGLLRDAARLVAPGGELAYVVCTIGLREGPGVVDRFLAFHPGFAPSGGFVSLPFHAGAFEAGPGCWWILTHRWGCDGFFVSRFRRS